jgi:hypothetical protein
MTAPRIITDVAISVLAPYFCSTHPARGDTNIETNPAAAAAPTISVRLQPRSSLIGKTNTAIVNVAAALRTNMVEPAARTIAHP